MKYIFFILTTLLLANAGFAQLSTFSVNAKRSNYEQRILTKLLPNAQPARAHKTTTYTSERLIAHSEFSHSVFAIDSVTIFDTSIMMDSAHYRYSGERTSDFSFNYMAYYNTYNLDGAGMFGFGSNVGFASRNDNPSMLSDTTEIYKLMPFTFTFGLFEIRYATYDSNDNITVYADVYVDSGFYTNNKYFNFFDGYGNISNSVSLSQNITMGYDSTEERIFTYDTAHRLTSDLTNTYSSGSWDPIQKWDYTYDDSGNMRQASYYYLVSSSWEEQQRYIMTYNTDNTLKTVSYYEPDTTIGWRPVYLDSFGYTSGVSYVTYSQTKEYMSGFLLNKSVVTKNVAVSGLPDSVVTEMFDDEDKYIYKYVTAYTYDGYDQPTVALRYNFIFDTAMVSGYYDTTYSNIVTYYYEEYERTNNVAPITKLNDTYVIYPNPSQGDVNISFHGKSGDAMTINIRDISGKVLNAENVVCPQDGQMLHKVDIRNLASGVYFIDLTLNDQHTVKKIVKL